MMILKIIRIIIAGFVAILILDIFCLAYYNIPMTFPSKTGATDFTYEKYKFYSSAIEGFGYGKINNEGMNNIYDYNSKEIDILIMGSSEMEGRQVPQTKTTASILNKLFNGSKSVYNIGIGGHDFSHIINNYKNAIEYYNPREYVIIEIGSIMFTMQYLDDIINYKIQSLYESNKERGIRYYLRNTILSRVSYLRFLVYKISQLKRVKENTEIVKELFSKEGYLEKLSMIMKRLYQINNNNEIDLIIFYHPRLVLQETGQACPNTDNEFLEAFKAACDNYNINFIDMTDIFIKEYNNNNILPHGFLNTAVGKGHLNKNGHNMIALELFEYIQGIKK